MQVVISEADYRLLMEERQKHNLKCVKRFNRKKFNHLNHKKYFNLYKMLGLTLSPIMYEIRYKSSFSPYLYLFLKKKAKPVIKNVEAVSSLLSVNFNEIIRKTKMTHHTVKFAFEDLVSLGLLLYTKDLNRRYDNVPKKAMLINDEYIVLFDPKKRKVVYSMSKQKEI